MVASGVEIDPSIHNELFNDHFGINLPVPGESPARTVVPLEYSQDQTPPQEKMTQSASAEMFNLDTPGVKGRRDTPSPSLHGDESEVDEWYGGHAGGGAIVADDEAPAYAMNFDSADEFFIGRRVVFYSQLRS